MNVVDYTILDIVNERLEEQNKRQQETISSLLHQLEGKNTILKDESEYLDIDDYQKLKDLIKQYIMQNMTIEIKKQFNGSNDEIKATLFLDGEEISSDRIATKYYDDY